MTPMDERASMAPRAAAAGRTAKPSPSPSAQPANSTDRLVFTIERPTGRLLKVEAADADGTHELSDKELADLAGKSPEVTLENIVAEAFEAGIACVLGGASPDEAPPESEGDAELSRVLLRSLIDRSAVKRLMQREVLSPAIVGALIAQAPGSRGASPDSSAAH